MWNSDVKGTSDTVEYPENPILESVVISSMYLSVFDRNLIIGQFFKKLPTRMGWAQKISL